MTNIPTELLSLEQGCENAFPAKGLGNIPPCLCKFPMANQSSILLAPTRDPMSFLGLNTEHGCKADHQSNCTAKVFTRHGWKLPYSYTEIPPLNVPQPIYANPFPKPLNLLAIRV